MTLEDLIAAAEEFGLRVKWDNLGRRAGELRRSGLVLLNHRKSVLTQRCTLAHEMGHWSLGHDWTLYHDIERDELAADAWAARLLISPVDYALAERLHGPHAGAIARELDVSTRLVEVWRSEVWKGATTARRKGHLRAV
ncbi:ImmA/IrrE family metallo-endopeptidase [Isoptericola sp. NPDC056605]|uniref:ImmA/IrrE family metallo-endopeptidase n=1 Tax=Isoptericola sp. NPDC056605 TaxID=3345876 RepID=UPI00367D1C50